MKILVLNGPNLNMLGKRDPKIYGAHTLEDINSQLDKLTKSLGVKLAFFQSNYEGELIDFLQKESPKSSADDRPSNFIAGTGSYFIAEACEYRRSFLN